MEAKEHFRLIAITPENPVDEEPAKIASLLDCGFYRVHLRHPGSSRTEIRDIIERIPMEMHGKIVLHGHFDLANDFNLGGLHLNRRCPAAPGNYNGPLSRSCHSVEEAMDAVGMTYVTLSPVFDSISKKGYHSVYSSDDLRRLDSTDNRVIALGGVTFSNLTDISGYNFAGAAMLGAIPWSLPLTEFKNKIESEIC